MSDDQIPEPDRVDACPHPRETFALYGQAAAETRFLEAWRGGRLHHAWLMRGPQGIGKATLAYRIARALIAQPAASDALFGPSQAEIPNTLEAQPDCPVRARIVARSEPRLFVLARRYDPEKKRVPAQILVDEVRRMRQFLQMSAADGGWRVVIVDSADEMNVNAANALLKFLEEPPAHCLFLLVSHAPAGLLPTIRSRCRTLDLAPLGTEALAQALAGAGAESTRAEAGPLAELSGGSAGRALRLAAEDGVALYARIVDLLHAGRGVNAAEVTQLAEFCAGRAAAARYATVVDLVQVLLARLARAAATGLPVTPAAPGEAALFAQCAAVPGQAAAWADALARLSARTRHAAAVNLDPAQTILDTFFEIDATLGRVRMAEV